MGLHPQVAPVIWLTPYARVSIVTPPSYTSKELTAVWVEVESAKVQCGDVENILPDVPSGTGLVRVAPITGSRGSEAFVAQGHHVVLVKGLDVLRC
jgi:hypothetical protein